MVSKSTIEQLSKYATVGFFGALINIAITSTLCAVFPTHLYVQFLGCNFDFWIAFNNGVGILVAFLFNFYWNKRWTFK